MYRRLRNWLVVGLLIILAAGFARYRYDRGLPLLGNRAESDSATAVEDSTVVSRGDLQVVVNATGSIAPAKRLPMFFLIPGDVAEVNVQPGDRVRAGDVLAWLDTTQLELALEEAQLALELQEIAFDALTGEPREEDVAVARAAVYAASAQLTAAQTNQDPNAEEVARLQLEIARNQLWQAQLQRDSAVESAETIAELQQQLPPPIAQGLYESGIGIPGTNTRQQEASVTQAEYAVAIAEQQLAQAQNQTANNANVAAASAALVSAQAQLDLLLEGPDDIALGIADAQLQSAYLAVEQARYQLEQAQLVAPFDGIVSAVNLNPGEAPPVNGPALELLDDSNYYINLAVDELDIAKVRVGQRAEVVLDALPDRMLVGTVTRLDQVGNTLGGLVTYNVRVDLEPTDLPVRAGLSATATVIVDEAFDVLRLRNRFIRIDRRTDEAFVTVRRPDGQLEDRQIVLGRRNDTFSEIVSGLSEGEEVVLLPRTGLTDFGF
ncbi:MAG: hypothetical protein Kow0077_03750 [Anaerolineae bacterium]